MYTRKTAVQVSKVQKFSKFPQVANAHNLEVLLETKNDTTWNNLADSL